MTDFLILNLWLLVFLFLVIGESKWQPKLSKIQKTTAKIPPSRWLLIFLLMFIATLTFLILGPNNWIQSYLSIAFSLIVIGHARWLYLSKTKIPKIFFFIGAIGLITGRFLTNFQLFHCLYILAALVWLGPLLTQIGLVNRKRFIILSLIWFTYDIFFVWITPLATQVQTTTEVVKFPLALAVGNNTLGTGDLLWAGLLLSLIKKRRKQIHAILVLVFSNLALGLYSYLTDQLTFFPLLVLWVPLGIIMLAQCRENLIKE